MKNSIFIEPRKFRRLGGLISYNPNNDHSKKKGSPIYSEISSLEKIIYNEKLEMKNPEINNIELINLGGYSRLLKYSLNKNFTSIISSQSGFNLTLKDSASVTANNIGEFALPIVEYINQTKPDYVVASDRGARLLGLAVFRLYHQLYGRFPTSDGTIRFRRFSKGDSEKATEQHLQPLVDEMLQYSENPNVLILDDWIVSGGTKDLAKRTFNRLGKGKINVKFGVMAGNNADISGNTSKTSGFACATDWRDDSDIIGVSYGTLFKEIKPLAVRSEQSFDYRRRMYEGIDRFAGGLIKESIKAVYARTK